MRKRTLARLAATAVVIATVGAVEVGARAAAPPARVALPDSVVSRSALGSPSGTVSAERSLTIQVWLTPQSAAAERFATAVSTPGSPRYRDFLTPDEYTARFAATAADSAAVIGWLRSQGFTAVRTDAQRDYVRATATVATINTAFRTTIERYRDTTALASSAARVFTNNRPLSVPARLAPDILGVTGLNNSPLAAPAAEARSMGSGAQGTCSAYWGQHSVAGLPRQLGSTRFAVDTCGYTGAQYRSAYGEDATNAGQGQTIAFAEAGGLEPDMFATLTDFARQNQLPAPSATRYQELNLQPASCRTHDASRGEEQMDVEAAYAMAPAADQLVVGADMCDHGDAGFQGGFDTDLAVIDGNGQAPLASIVSNSWETGYDDQAPDINQIEAAFLVKAAAVGVGMYYSAGDDACVTQPASNPYATGVGATLMGISKSGRRLFETGGAFAREFLEHGKWTSPRYFGYAGGESLLYRQPAYQKSVVPPAMSTPASASSTLPGHGGGCRSGGTLPARGHVAMRSAPDVSADGADGLRVGIITNGRYGTINDAATSLSAPLVAGMVAAAQTGQAKPFGFINPALYRLAGSPALYDPRPITPSDPLSWRAVACPASDSLCGGATALWLIDDQSAALPGYGKGQLDGYTGQVTRRGYDNTTGVGVPSGQTFIRAMRKLG